MGGLLFILIAVAVFSAAIDAAGPGTLRVGTFNVRNSGAGDGAERLAAPAVGPDRARARRPARRDRLSRGPGRPAGRPGGGVGGLRLGRHAPRRRRPPRRGRAGILPPRPLRPNRRRHVLAIARPDRPGPPAWDAACPRICTWVVLHDRPAGRRVALFNTHFDHVGETAKLESARLIVRRLSERPEPVVLLGDFNSTEDGPVYAALLAAARDAGRPLTDAHREVHPTPAPDEATYHGFTETTEGLRIDWILHDRNAVAVDSRIGPAKSVDGRYASDHSPCGPTCGMVARASRSGL